MSRILKYHYGINLFLPQ